MRVRLLVANICGAMLIAGTAQAADLATKMVTKAPPVPVFSWTGFYIGAQGGYGWAQNDFSNSYDLLYPESLAYYGSADAGYTLDGGFAGGVIGYNYQFANNVVLGVEADANWADISGSGLYYNPLAADPLAGSCVRQNDACSSKIDAFGTITARLGYAFDHVLVYAKGGAAWASFSHDAGNTDLAYPEYSYYASADQTRWGWTVGAGVEWAFANNWSVKAEYDYMDFGSSDVTFNFFPNTYVSSPVVSSVSQDLQVIKGGVNYRF